MHQEFRPIIPYSESVKLESQNYYLNFLNLTKKLMKTNNNNPIEFQTVQKIQFNKKKIYKKLTINYQKLTCINKNNNSLTHDFMCEQQQKLNFNEKNLNINLKNLE